MYLNRVTLIGYLARDAELRAAVDSNPYTVLTLVTKATWKDQSNQWKSHSEFHRCIVWGGKFAEIAATLKRGAHLQIEGELRTREYQKDGMMQRVFEVRTHSVLQLSRAWRQTESLPQDLQLGESPT